MIDLEYDPPLPGRPGEALVQTVRMRSGEREIARGTWRGSGAQGVAQVVDLQVVKEGRRKGVGGVVLGAMIEQMKQYFQRRGGRLRRVWIGVEQKRQVQVRAFLTHEGFHHTQSLTGLLRDEDLLVYVRDLD